MPTIEVRHYQTAEGSVPLSEWLEKLRDVRARARIVARLNRLRAGLMGDWKSVGEGVRELREKAHDYWKDYKARKHAV